MPNRVSWEPGFSLGHEVIDAQHQALLSHCNMLADHCTGAGGEQAERGFDQAFEQLKFLARQHFETEASLLAACGYPDTEDHRIDCDEFEYLADEIATTANFDRLELQRFIALWCVGHIVGSAAQRDYLGGTSRP